MTTDLFKQVKLNPGQEVRSADLNNMQKFMFAKIMDQLVDSFNIGDLNESPDSRGSEGENAPTKWAYALNPTAGRPEINLGVGSATDKIVNLGAGVLMQKLGNKSGAEATLVPFELDGDLQFTISDGHATMPRVDIIQMKLEYDDTDAESRVFATEAEYATIDMGALTTAFDTVFRARVKGTSGENIQVRTVTGGVAAYAESGNLITLTYVDGVTTVAALEALVTANSTLIVVGTAGTAGNVLNDPADTQGYTALSGGVDTVLVSQSMDTGRRIVGTFSVKAGTPTAAPAVIPAPDAGYVPVAAVVVPPAWVAGGVNQMRYADAPTGLESGVLYATLMDLRMPINVKRHDVYARDLIYDRGRWEIKDNGRYVKGGITADTLMIPASMYISINAENAMTAAHVRNHGYWVMANDTDPLTIPVQLPLGAVITGYAVGMVKSTGIAQSYNSKLQKTSDTGVTTDASAGHTNAENAPGATYMQEVGLSVTVQAGFTYHIVITPPAGGGGDTLSGTALAWKLPLEGSDTALYARCPGVRGRLVAVGMIADDGGAAVAVAKLVQEKLGGTDAELVKVAGFVGDMIGDSTLRTGLAGRADVESAAQCLAPAATGYADYGMPIWTNGQRCLWDEGTDFDGGGSLSLRVDLLTDLKIYKVSFYIAEGL